MYDRILLPTDGSDGTSVAVDHAIDIATTYDASLHALFVVDETVGANAAVPGAIDALKQGGRAAVDEIVSRARAGGVDTVEGSVIEGLPHQAIVTMTDEDDIDLIVMGTHGRSGLDRYLIGSVTERVVRSSPVPVLAVPLPDDEAGVP
jgi:nucleotide-binding universal stress UspA family protein